MATRRSIRNPPPGDANEIAERLRGFHMAEANAQRPRAQFRPKYRTLTNGGSMQPVEREIQSYQPQPSGNSAALGKARTYLSRAMAAANSGDLAKVQAQLAALSNSLDEIE